MKMNSTFLKVGLLFFFSINISIITGCFDSGGEGIPYYTVSDEFAEYCWYEAGSTWIYQNDSTLATESITIDEVNEIKRFNPAGVDYNYQAVDMLILANNLNFTKLEITAGNNKPDPGEMNSLLRLYKDDGSYHLVFCPEYAIGEEINLGDNIGVYSNVEIIDSLQLVGNTYTNVYHTRVIIEVGANIEYNYWIASNYGLVKFVAKINEQTSSISLKSASLIAHQ